MRVGGLTLTASPAHRQLRANGRKTSDTAQRRTWLQLACYPQYRNWDGTVTARQPDPGDVCPRACNSRGQSGLCFVRGLDDHTSYGRVPMIRSSRSTTARRCCAHRPWRVPCQNRDNSSLRVIDVLAAGRPRRLSPGRTSPAAPQRLTYNDPTILGGAADSRRLPRPSKPSVHKVLSSRGPLPASTPTSTKRHSPKECKVSRNVLGHSAYLRHQTNEVDHPKRDSTWRG